MITVGTNIFVQPRKDRRNGVFLAVEDVVVSYLIAITSAIEYLRGAIAQAIQVEISTHGASFTGFGDNQFGAGDIDLADTLGQQEKVLLLGIMLAIAT